MADHGSTVSLEKLTSAELITECCRLRAHVKQLRNVIQKNKCGETNECSVSILNIRRFQFSDYNSRHVLLRIAYIGWLHDGFVTQENSSNTVENLLFKAMLRARLIESRQKSNYHRCGRTDKGVSAYCQVISIDLRSNAKCGVGVTQSPSACKLSSEDDDRAEVDYVHILNSNLPDSIRVLAWCPVDINVSARFTCTQRIYHYYFNSADLDLEEMRVAGEKLIGEHDFRNFCKMDIAGGVSTFIRRIDEILIEACDHNCDLSETSRPSTVVVKGSSFLWHQVRYIVSILLLVGLRLEQPSSVEYLLDVKRCPSRPNYEIANALPLVLYECKYDTLEPLRWIGPADREKIIAPLRYGSNEAAIQHQILRTWLTNQLSPDAVQYHGTSLSPSQKTPSNSVWPFFLPTPGLVHHPIAERQRAKTAEDRIANLPKQKLDKIQAKMNLRQEHRKLI